MAKAEIIRSTDFKLVLELDSGEARALQSLIGRMTDRNIRERIGEKKALDIDAIYSVLCLHLDS